MNKTILKLKKQYDALKQDQQKQARMLEDQLRGKLFKVFEKDKDIQKIVKKLNDKPDGYQYGECGNIEAWYRIDSKTMDKFEDYWGYLDDYFSEYHCARLDKQYDAVLVSHGPEEIIINEDGDVFLGNKVIIEKNMYQDKKQRNVLIEEYMEKTGYFPGVFYQDHYGNLILVNTRGE